MTSKGSKVIIGFCSLCNRKKSMTFSDNTIQADGIGSFFKNLGKITAKAGKKTSNQCSQKNRQIF